MTYRIRYRTPRGAQDGEMVVEANSPTEAMIKFQCAHQVPTGAVGEDAVTSVRAEESCCDPECGPDE